MRSALCIGKMRIESKSLRIKEKIRHRQMRSKRMPMRERILKLGEIILGLVNYFSIAGARSHMARLDEITRPRLRIVLWKQWKGITGRARNLMKLGIAKKRAYQLVTLPFTSMLNEYNNSIQHPVFIRCISYILFESPRKMCRIFKPQFVSNLIDSFFVIQYLLFCQIRYFQLDIF